MPEPRFLEIAPDRRLAYHRVEGAAPAVLFCGGYTSDMTGTKALALEHWCRGQGRGFVRFDYGGHGQSTGRFEDGTIASWPTIRSRARPRQCCSAAAILPT